MIVWKKIKNIKIRITESYKFKIKKTYFHRYKKLQVQNYAGILI